MLGLSGWLMLLAPFLYCLIKVLVVDTFLVPSESMNPTLQPGDKIRAWKLPYGARIYCSLDFSSRYPHCFRLPGLGKIVPADILVFNSPKNGTHGDSIWFTINDVCCKRVLGCPGDRIGAVDGHCWNDRILKPVGSYEMQEMLRWTFDSIYVWSNQYHVFPEALVGWNIKNWGPLTVPYKGMEIDMTKPENAMYRSAVEYETESSSDTVETDYVFKHDWYFVLGDNAPVSYDSRFFGFVPDDFIIGVLRSKRTWETRSE